MDTSVALVEAYFRLNGYFTVTEFQVQHPVASQPGKFETATDLDILAVRLPYAAETVLRHPEEPGEDRCEILLAEEPALAADRNMPDIIIGEVKEDAAELNRKLKTPEVLHTALRRVGCCPEEHISAAVDALMRSGEFISALKHGVACRVRLVSFCGHVDESRPLGVLTVTLGHIFKFIQERLIAYRDVLRSAHFKDPTLNLFKLMEKLDLRLASEEAA